jgi:CDP-diacylglycerol--inositol 3-phosphatidyltransferase
MVTDRVSTCGLLVIVSHLYPKYMFFFAMLIVLDITSHWFHVMRSADSLFFSSLLFFPFNMVFSVAAHHKSAEALEHRNALLQWYYSIYPLFGYCCVGTELFYVLLYVIHHFPNPTLRMVSFFL